jgi:hypothetical protein
MPKRETEDFGTTRPQSPSFNNSSWNLNSTLSRNISSEVYRDTIPRQLDALALDPNGGRMLELHVWGPAFGLPSIDAHCLAAIAYLQQAVPRGKWQLIASSDPSLSPTSITPAFDPKTVAKRSR